MKIVHVMNWYIPDMGYQENFLPAEQQKLGHEVTIITSDRIPFYKGFDNHVGRILPNRIIGSGESKENGVSIYRLPILFEIKDGGIIALWGLRKTLKKIKPDIVHAHGPYNIASIISLLYCKKIGYKIFIDDHSNAQNFHIDTIPKKIYIGFLKVFYFLFERNVSGWMPVAEPAKKILVENFNIQDEKMKIIPLGIATERFFKSASLREECRKEFSLNDNDILIITTGKLDEAKDIEILIEAFFKVLQKNQKVKLLIIGNGPQEYMEKITNLINEKNIKNSIIFKDFVKNSELPRYYNAADIGVWPGTHTITAVESLATGLPVIIPDDDMSYKNIFEHQAAMGFKRKDSSSLTEAIQLLINNFEATQNIKKNALSLANNQLSWETIAKKTLHQYTQSK